MADNRNDLNTLDRSSVEAAIERPLSDAEWDSFCDDYTGRLDSAADSIFESMLEDWKERMPE